MQYQRTAEHLINDIETRWPDLIVTEPGGATFRYTDEIAVFAFDMFHTEAEGSRFRLRESSALSNELAKRAIQLQDWSIDFAALERKEQYLRLGKVIYTGRKKYSLRMSVLPPLPDTSTL